MTGEQIIEMIKKENIQNGKGFYELSVEAMNKVTEDVLATLNPMCGAATPIQMAALLNIYKANVARFDDTQKGMLAILETTVSPTMVTIPKGTVQP